MISINVTGENAFQVNAASFGVSPSTAGYTLAYSADGTNFTNYSEATPANENLIVNGAVNGMFYKLVGNTGTVTIKY